ncbi:MAG: phage tail protein, partial [Chloroflexi bacterium]|nr:phage tail protein [Chloroflexota bacterium]
SEQAPPPTATSGRTTALPVPTPVKTNGVSASSVSTNGSQRGFTGGRFVLTLDNSEVQGFVQSVDGGNIKAEVVTEQVGPDSSQRKHLATLKYEDITIEVGMGMGKALYQWIEDSLDQRYTRKNGAIVAADFDYGAMSVREFYNALITEVGFPALDAASKDAAYMTIKMSPETIVYKDTSSAGDIQGAVSLTKAQKQWLPSNFRFTLGDLPTSRVNKIDAFTIKQSVARDEIGDARDYLREPGKLEIPNLKLTISAADIQPWYVWFEDFVIKGNATQDKELSGSITLLGPDLKEELATIELKQVGIFSLGLEPQDANQDAFARFKVELYVEQMSFQYSVAASGDAGASKQEPPVASITLPADVIGRLVTISYQLFDSTSDPVSVEAAFSIDGGRTFRAATAAASPTQRLATSPSGEAHTFIWNSAADLGEAQAEGVLLRITPMDTEVGKSATTPPLLYHPLKDAVAEACGVRDDGWRLTADGWETLRKLLAECQDRVVASLEAGLKELDARLRSSPGGAASRESLDASLGQLPDLRARLGTFQESAILIRGEAQTTIVVTDSLGTVDKLVVELEQRLSLVGDDAQLANLDLQAEIQQQQQTLQTISNVSKMMHDTAMAVIRNLKG